MTYQPRSVTMPAPPSHPMQSSEVRLLAVHLDCWLGGVGFDGGQWQTAINREEARAAGELSPIAHVAPNADAELVQAFAAPADQTLATILGYVDDAGAFCPGRADLSARESEAMNLHINGLPVDAIRDAMDRGKRQRRRRGMPLSIRTVEDHLSNARGKLRALFGEA